MINHSIILGSGCFHLPLFPSSLLFFEIWPHYIDLTVLELTTTMQNSTNLLAYASQKLGLKACTTKAQHSCLLRNH